MTESTARELFAEIRATSLIELRDDLFRYALRYAHARAEWCLADSERQIEMDMPRHLAHECLIDACNVLSRNQAKAGEPTAWRGRLGSDLREIGDLACWIHAFLGLEAR